RISAECGRDLLAHFDISLPPGEIRSDTPFHAGPAVFALLTNARLLDVVEDVLGPEIYSNPVQHVRIKLPKPKLPQGYLRDSIIDTPWHQDMGVLTGDADNTDVLTVWSPLSEARVDNGCLVVIPRSHMSGLLTHCENLGIAIPEELLPGEPRPVPMK